MGDARIYQFPARQQELPSVEDVFDQEMEKLGPVYTCDNCGAQIRAKINVEFMRCALCGNRFTRVQGSLLEAPRK